MTQQELDGGAQGDRDRSFSAAGYVEDLCVWNKGNLDLDGAYRVKILSIVPEYTTNFFSTRIRVGGEDFGAGAIVSGKNVVEAAVRLYKDSAVPSSQFRVDGTYNASQIDRAVRSFDQSGVQLTRYDETALSGYYDWVTVPTAPGIGTPTVNGGSVTVTYTNSSSTGGAGITSYNMQYSSNDGATWSTAVTVTGNTHTFSLLGPITYKFRVYATNEAGNGAASVSTAVTTANTSRGRVYKDGAWVQGTVGRVYKDGSWQNITVFRKYNGTSWVDLTI
jgi:hypothetical protein